MAENVVPVETAETPPEEAVPPTRLRILGQRLWRIGGLFFSLVIALTIWVLLSTFLPNIADINPELLTNALRGAIIVIAGFLPAIIFGYFQSRRQILFNEYKLNLARLGLNENALIYKNKFDAIYGNNDMSTRGGIVFQTPIVISTLLSIIGWIVVFYPPPAEAGSLTPNATTLAYGFLGAYIFAIGSLVRQYVTDDLQQRYYASIVYRYLAIFVLAGLITFMFPATETAVTGDIGETISNAANQVTNPPSGWILTLAFTFGFLPSMGIRWVVRFAVRISTSMMNSVSKVKVRGIEDEHPLNLLQGPNAYHEDRLLLEGIENIQNLACADIVDLMLKTRFPVEQLVDWIDQSLLYLHTGPDSLEYFRLKGVRTATDFIDIYEELDPRVNGASVGLLDADTKLTIGQINNIYVALQNDPNMYHIRYWREHQFELLAEDVALTQQANLKLMQGYPDEAVVMYDELIRQFPKYYQGHFYRGLAHTAATKYGRASEDFRTALTLAEKKWELATTAHLQLGKALQNLGQIEEAAAAYEQAFHLNPDFNDAHLAYAELQLAQKKFRDAINHFSIVVGNNFRKAESSTSLGLAQFEQWKLKAGTTEQQAALLTESEKNLKEAIRLKPTLLVPYINLGLIYEELNRDDEAIEIYTKFINRPESDTDKNLAYLARFKRGSLYYESGQNQLALVDLQDAINLSPSPIAYYNLGQTHARLGQTQLALNAFNQAVSLDPKYLEAYNRLGEAALQAGNFNDAIETYNREIKIQQERGNLAGQMAAHLNLGRAYRGAKQIQNAHNELQKAANLSTKLGDDTFFTIISYEMGLTHFAANEMDVAADIFANSAEFLDIDGKPIQSIEARIYSARALTALKEFSDAINELDLALEQLDDPVSGINPAEPDAIRLRGEIDKYRAEVKVAQTANAETADAGAEAPAANPVPNTNPGPAPAATPPQIITDGDQVEA